MDYGKIDGLTRVDAHHLGGALLRRYWHPVCALDELATRDRVRITMLGEALLLFRDETGELRLVQELCPHRGASLFYGFVEDGGIRCPYHGWLFSGSGACLEKPFEPRFRQRADVLRSYPTRVAGGLVFTYLGPPAFMPEFPMWDLLVRDRGRRYIEVQPDLKANWLQIQENAADVTHTFFLHSYMLRSRNLPDTSGFDRPMAEYGFQPFEFGLLKNWTYEGVDGGAGWGNLLVFPNMLRLESEMHWRVPVDDETTRIIVMGFESPSGADPEAAVPDRYDPDLRITGDDGDYHLTTFQSQDAMAFETPGRMHDRRRNETLGASDIGIVMFRNMLIEQAELAYADGHPVLGALPAGSDPFVDLRVWMGGDRAMSCEPDEEAVARLAPDAVFDHRHRTVSVPRGGKARRT